MLSIEDKIKENKKKIAGVKKKLKNISQEDEELKFLENSLWSADDMSEYIKEKIDQHSKHIEELRKDVTEVEKNQTAIDISIKYLSENINKLTVSIDKLSDEVNRKGIGHFFKENWFRIPTMIVILYGIIHIVGSYDHRNSAFKSVRNSEFIEDTTKKKEV